MTKTYDSVKIEDNEDEIIEEIVDDNVNEDEVIEKIVNDNVEKIDDFVVTFNAPTIINNKLIFSATIASETGIMFNGNMRPLASVENEDAHTVKLILETIKADTKAAINQLDINKDWNK